MQVYKSKGGKVRLTNGVNIRLQSHWVFCIMRNHGLLLWNCWDIGMLLKLRSHYRNIVELHNKEADWSRRHIWNGSSKNKHPWVELNAREIILMVMPIQHLSYIILRTFWFSTWSKLRGFLKTKYFFKKSILWVSKTNKRAQWVTACGAVHLHWTVLVLTVWLWADPLHWTQAGVGGRLRCELIETLFNKRGPLLFICGPL